MSLIVLGKVGRRMLSEGVRWENPYVTDGLISMYDGEWNAGGGVHAQSGCVDLIGCFGDIVTDLVSDKSVLFSTQDVVQNGTEFTSALENCNTDGMTIELVYTMDTSVMPNRNSLPSFIRIANNNIFSYGQYCAVDSHPAYATCQERMSIRAKSYSGSSYSNIANGETVKITAVKTADTLNMYFNGVVKLSTGAVPTYAVPAIGYVTFNYGWKSPVNSFRIYNRALTDAEIAANFAVDRARFNIA